MRLGNPPVRPVSPGVGTARPQLRQRTGFQPDELPFSGTPVTCQSGPDPATRRQPDDFPFTDDFHDIGPEKF